MRQAGEQEVVVVVGEVLQEETESDPMHSYVKEQTRRGMMEPLRTMMRERLKRERIQDEQLVRWVSRAEEPQWQQVALHVLYAVHGVVVKVVQELLQVHEAHYSHQQHRHHHQPLVEAKVKQTSLVQDETI